MQPKNQDVWSLSKIQNILKKVLKLKLVKKGTI
jgi:hypothetical protein